MPNEYGFKFEIRGEVFVAQASKAGADIVAAYDKTVETRLAIIDALSAVPATFTITEPVATSRRASGNAAPPDPANGIDPPAEDGPTPELDLPSRKGKAKP